MATSETFSSFLKTLLDQYNVKPSELAKGIGVTKSYLTELYKGRTKPFTMERCEQAAEFLMLKSEDKKKLIRLALIERSDKDVRSIVRKSLNTKSDVIPLSEDPQDYAKIPILGKCPASAKAWVADEVEAWHPFPKQLVRGRRLYLLRAHGDSMNRAGIDDKDLVIVDADAPAMNGRIVVICIDNEYTIKRFHKSGNVVTLSPDSNNPDHSPMTFSVDECDMNLRGVVEAVHYKKLR